MGSSSTEELVTSYLVAKRTIVEHGYEGEIAWQAQVARERPTPRSFLREAAWVVLSTGMREAVIRKTFPSLERAFLEFEPIEVVRNRAVVRARAVQSFNHQRKIDAILGIAEAVQDMTTADLARALEDPEDFLRSLPYIGPVTWRHLAKNLGAPLTKPDRHLVRVAAASGRESVDSLCREIAASTGEPISVVDLVLWRWSVVRASYCHPLCHTVPPELLSRLNNE